VSIPVMRATLWRDGRFVRLFSARVVSVLGNGFGRVALAFAVLELPDATPGRLSVVLACQAVPQLVFILLGGVIADRVSRSALMAGADCVGALAYLGLAVFTFSGWSPLLVMCAFAVLAGTATAMFAPAMDGVVPLLVARDQLQRANGMLRVGTNSSMVMGLALSGVTVAAVGAGWALAINAISFVVSAFLTGGLRVGTRPPKASSACADLRDGWREFISRQWLWVIVGQYAVVVAALNAYVGVLGPLMSEHGLGGAATWASIVAAQAFGALVGAGVASRIRVARPLLVAVVATLPTALPIALLSLSEPVWIVAAAAFLSGIASDIFGVLWITTIHREVPEEALSRISSYDWFGSLAFAPLGLLIAGPLATSIGISQTLVACAVLIVAATVTALVSPAVRNLRADRPVSHPDKSGAPRPDRRVG
jgi:predicted MFS family arabinose efflux permease